MSNGIRTMELSVIGQIASTCWIEIPNHFPFVKLGEFIVMPNHIHGIITIDKPIHNDLKNAKQYSPTTNNTVLFHMTNRQNRSSTIDASAIIRIGEETQDLASLSLHHHHKNDGEQPDNFDRHNNNDGEQPNHLDPDHNNDGEQWYNITKPGMKNENPQKTNRTKNQFAPQSRNLGSVIRGYKTGVTKYARKRHPSFAWQARYHDSIIRNRKSFERIQHYIRNNPKKWKNDCFNRV